MVTVSEDSQFLFFTVRCDGTGDVQSDCELGPLGCCRTDHQPSFAAFSKQPEPGPGGQAYVTSVNGLEASAEMKTKSCMSPLGFL